MSKDRTFPLERIKHGDDVVNAQKIECSKCETKAYFPQTGRRLKPPEATNNYFRAKGWTVGGGPRADKCPQCAHSKPKSKVVKKGTKSMSNAPRKMERDDRRIVFAAIDDHYLGEGQGYDAPWTDRKIAEDLNVPMAWVAEVREDMFGMEGSNELYDEFIEKAAPVIAEMRNMHNSLRVQAETLNKFKDRIVELEKLAKKIA